MLFRACTAFVDNLAQLLRVALIVGAIFLVRDLHDFRNEISPEVAVVEPVTIIQKHESGPDESLLTERVQHFLNCTYEEYRREHYDECTNGQSRIYGPPQADPDDMGNVLYKGPILLARLDNYVRAE